MASIIDFFTNILTSVGNILSYLNPLSENFILKGVLEFLGNILDYLNPLSENFILKIIIEFLIDILDYLNPFSENFFGLKLMDLLGDLLKFLFIPSEERLTAITNTVSSKFDFIETIKEAINSVQNILNNLGNAPKLTVNVDSKYYEGELTYIDMSWYEPFRPYGDIVITGFVYLFFLWRLFVHAPDIINGTGGDFFESDNKEVKL